MSNKNRFIIELAGLKEDKSYDYQFVVGNSFFEDLDQTFVTRGDFVVNIALSRSSSVLMVLDFDIIGKMELTCDRSLKNYFHPIHTARKLVYKFGDRNEEVSDEVIMVKSDSERVDVTQAVFDFIALEIPAKKIHPDYLTETDDTNDDAHTLIYTSSTSGEEDDVFVDINIDVTDPRWEALKQLKNKQ